MDSCFPKQIYVCKWILRLNYYITQRIILKKGKIKKWVKEISDYFKKIRFVQKIKKQLTENKNKVGKLNFISKSNQFASLFYPSKQIPFPSPKTLSFTNASKPNFFSQEQPLFSYLLHSHLCLCASIFNGIFGFNYPYLFILCIIFLFNTMQQWTTQEDECLLKLHQEIKVYNRWKEISRKMLEEGFQRNQLQCRNRYHNKLDPALKLEKWSTEEVKKIFQFYDEYGSKWNLIEAFIPGRTQNNIKNRFFSTLKNLVRKLLKYLEDAEIEKKLKYICSKDITELYDGRGKFKKFKGLMKKILKEIHYEIEIKSVTSIIENYQQILVQLARIFTQSQSSTGSQKPEPSKKLSIHNSQVSSAASENKINEKKMENEQSSSANLPEQNFFFNYSLPLVGFQENGMIIMGNPFFENMWMNQVLVPMQFQSNAFGNS